MQHCFGNWNFNSSVLTQISELHRKHDFHLSLFSIYVLTANNVSKGYKGIAIHLVGWPVILHFFWWIAVMLNLVHMINIMCRYSWHTCMQLLPLSEQVCDLGHVYVASVPKFLLSTSLIAQVCHKNVHI